MAGNIYIGSPVWTLFTNCVQSLMWRIPFCFTSMNKLYFLWKCCATNWASII